MTRRVRGARAFTLLELVVVLSIILILVGLGVLALQRDRPRANLATVSTDLYALIRNARANAMATGRNTIVLVFPAYTNPFGGVGRVLVIEDPGATFFQSPTSPNFESFDPASGRIAADTEILQTLDFPRGTRISGTWSTTLTAPYAGISIASACGFCSSGLDGRGAVQYDSRGRATFHSANGAALDVFGANLVLRALDPGGTSTVAASGMRMLVLTSSTGSVRSLIGG